MMRSCTLERLDCIHRLLHDLFSHYGLFVSRHPLPFLVIPVLVACLMGIGLLRLQQETDALYLFTPRNARGKSDRETVQRLFPMNDSTNFDGRRLSTYGAYLFATITSKSTDSSVMRADVLNEILRLDGLLRSIEFPMPYSQVCAMRSGQCVNDALLEMIEQDNSRYVNKQFTFPVTEDGLFIGESFGGLSFVSENHIEDALAVKIRYWLQESSVGYEWQDEAVHQLAKFRSEIILVESFTSRSLDNENSAITSAVLPLFILAIAVLIIFAVMSLLMLDWVQSKVYVGLLGIACPLLAVLASFGLLSAFGLEFNSVVGGMPFLIIGIGVDDMFIIVEAFRHTSPEDSVEKRMEKTFADAAVSITITSLTDFLGFMIGAISVFPAVFAFCIFTAVAVIFDYILQITFFAACMAYDARREDTNRHSCTMRVVLPRSLCTDKHPSYRLFCSGGVKHDGQVIEQRKERLAPQLIRKYYGPLLVRRPVKVLVIALWLFYFGISVYGCTQIEQGIELKNLARDDSEVHRYFVKESQYFSLYGPEVSFTRPSPANYWEKAVQKEVDREIADIVASRYASSPPIVTWWLNYYLNYLNATRGTTDISNATFLEILQNEFLSQDRYAQFMLDIRFSEDNSIVEATRFFVQTSHIAGATLEKDMMVEFRDIADKHGLVPYQPLFVFYDHYLAVLSNTLQNIGIALGVMLVIALLIIPHPWCAVLVVLTIVSIFVGVIGLMSFWDVDLDFITMITLIMCIGFSVDFSAHITYAFTVSRSKKRDDRSVDALYQLGYPTVQGALSTILAVVPLSFVGSYTFRSFFKTIFLVMVLSLFHGFVVFPVVLSVVGVRGKSEAGQKQHDKELDVTEGSVFVSYETGSKYQIVKRMRDRRSPGVSEDDSDDFTSIVYV